MARTPERDDTSSGHDELPDGAGSGATVTRSEERLVVGTSRRVSGRAVLRKYVVTETVTQTFEVRHEEVRLEQVPATDSDRDVSQHSDAADDVVEVILHREVPVVEMKVVAVERVRLRKEMVTRQEPVSEQLRKERVEISTPDQISTPNHSTTL